MTATAELQDAHAAVLATIAAIPDAAFDWQPGQAEWSLKRVIGHLAHANAFYGTIVEEARASGFGTVRLHRGSAGWQRMLAIDTAVAACSTVSAALEQFEQSYQDVLRILHSISPRDLDRPFGFSSWQPGAETVTTTLRQRVLQEMAHHLREHMAQLSMLLTRWQSEQ